ncbi:hypothetical protein ACA910_017291 [Epithemia clementina (nom. ined.)]
MTRPVQAFVSLVPPTAARTSFLLHMATLAPLPQQPPTPPQSPTPQATFADLLVNGASSSSSTTTMSSSSSLENDKVSQPRWRKSTKQVATLGPASSTLEMIEALFLAGADMFRLNFSHGNPEQKLDLLQKIRHIEAKHRHPIAILGDLQGPKLRVGVFANPEGEVLQPGQLFRLDSDATPGNAQRVQLPHPEILQAADIGHALLVDDGKVKLVVRGKGPGYLDCTVVVAGRIKDRKGVNTPDSLLPMSPLTPKDRRDLEYQMDIGCDWIALSFVQTPDDIIEIRTLMDDYARRHKIAIQPALMAKIEKPSCFDGDNLRRIVQLCDGIMVARGDLGVECPPEDVPLLQKQIIDECRQQGKPVVVATQMLESMIDNPTPTRAEASDVSTAIYDGADAIMLSAESAAGKYPVESVTMQQRIINRVERDVHYRTLLHSADFFPTKTPADALITAARQIAQTIQAKAIVCFSLRGTTVLRASKTRPSVPILALCPFKETARQLALSWGVYPDLPEEGSYGPNADHMGDLTFVASSSASKKAVSSGGSSSSSTSTSTTTTMEQLAKEWGARNRDADEDRRTTTMAPNSFSATTTTAQQSQPQMPPASPLLQQPDYNLPATDDFDLVLRHACTAAMNKGLVSNLDDLLVVTAGLPFGTPGAANILRIVPAAGPSCWDGLCRVED